MMRAILARTLAACAWFAGCGSGSADNGQRAVPAPPTVPVIVDTRTVLHRIDPAIYGTAFATAEQLRDLNVPFNRSGGNSATLYDWRNDARGTGADFYFESLPVTGAVTDQFHHGFAALTKAGGAQPIVTIPAIGWTAKLGAGRTPLAAFSQRKYGTQQVSDTQWFPDAGNGVYPNGTPVTQNDPTDAARQVDSVAEARARVEDLVARWGRADKGGVPYYAVDNEPGLWHKTHRSVRKEGVHARELADTVLAVAGAIKAADPSAKVIAPDLWGWFGYLASGYDQQGHEMGRSATRSDRTLQTAGTDLLPWLLAQWHKSGAHPVDVVSVHYYPQGGEFNDGSAGSRTLQLLRNRSTRALWDTAYQVPAPIDAPVALIPRLRGWVDGHYIAGTPIAVTEYSWGGDRSMSGATAQADIWGIFGRYGLDMAVRWATPETDTPVYKAMRLIRNPDGQGTSFGDQAFAVTVPDPDALSAFAARRDDGSLTVLIVNKSLDNSQTIRVAMEGWVQEGLTAKLYRLANDRLEPVQSIAVRGGVLNDTLPAQSVSFYRVPDHDG